MTIIQLYTYTLLKYSHSLHNKGQEDKKFDYLYLKKYKYFEMQYREKDALNDVLKYIQPSKFC